MKPEFLVNSVTLVRIPLAFVTVVFFQPDPYFVTVSLVAVLLALCADIADGFLARKYSVATLDGQLWDSLADKAVYIAAFIAFSAHAVLWPVLAWALIFRDVSLYVVRVIYYENIENMEKQKSYSRFHGLLVYMTIFFGYFAMYIKIEGGSSIALYLPNFLAVITLSIGVHNIWKFISTK